MTFRHLIAKDGPEPIRITVVTEAGQKHCLASPWWVREYPPNREEEQ